MNYTEEYPTAPGAYWWKWKEHSKPILVRIEEGGYLETGLLPMDVKGWWCGPLSLRDVTPNE